MTLNPQAPGSGRFAVDPELQDLMDLCLNNLDAFSAVLFTADFEGGPMNMKALQSLSKNIDPLARIRPGYGLLGWVYKNDKAVNVDQVSFETERLLFYTTDENIKSFMAVPLPEIRGVLAVDSKQRYVFTDKSGKLLFQFGKSISKVFSRTSGAKTGKNRPGDKGSGGVAEGLENEVCALWRSLEDLLSRPDHEGGGLSPALEAVRSTVGLSWAFLTLLFPDDKRHYHIVAKSDNVPDTLAPKAPLNSGLAGWVHSNIKHLGIDRLKAEGRNSYIFTKEEPIKGVKSFYGWPVIYNGNLRGALILAGRDGEVLSPVQAEIAECAAARFAAQMHLDHLIARFADMGGVDSQTNLPHRGYFIEDLNRMMGVADLKGEEMNLFVLATSGLGSFACEHGQDAAAELLRSIAKELKDGLRETWALGHVSYGVFTLAIPSSDAAEAKKLIKKFQAHLTDWPLTQHSGRASLGLFLAMASYPRDAAGPEELLEVALTALADGDDADESDDE
ncbi:hypothetical protein C4J81_10865 [Deltaproteobacteria bacterium Smac51]|nr:hypothetical protein C4J81_10865 [Deltaproteobacteria bacterium Smac51]